MSIRKIKSSSGQTRWEVRVYENGRGSKRVAMKFDRKVDAEAWLVDFEKKKSEVIRNPFSNISFQGRTFLEEADYWVQDGENRFSPGHLVKSKAIIKEHLAKYGNLPLAKYTPELLTTIQQRELKSGSTPATANRKSEVITAILNHSVKHRRIPFNPATGFRKLRKSQKEMGFWNLEEAQDFLSHINEKYPQSTKDRWVYAVYLLALNTAMRAGEIWGLKGSDLLEQQNAIVIKRQFNRVISDFSPTKSKKPRAVPANKILIEELKLLILQNKVTEDETIFINEQRKPICHDNFADRRFIKDLKSWGGRQIRFHDMRHTATTLMIANNVDLKTVKEICGHADITTTMNYVHLVSGSIEKVAMNFSITHSAISKNSKLKIVG